jgi:cell division protein FtsW (lipid II flippase)
MLVRFSKKDTIMSQRITYLVILLFGFTVLTGYVAITAENNIIGSTTNILSSVSSLQFQILVDLYVLVVLYLAWMIPDSHRLGFAVWQIVLYVILALILVSIGIIPYLIHRQLLVNQHR